MNPFAVLGIDTDERDPGVIRKAYAAKLREHRPDEDPEGFRRVREAYEIVRNWSRWYEEEAEEETPFEEERIEFAPMVERRPRRERRDRSESAWDSNPDYAPVRRHSAVIAWKEAEQIESDPDRRAEQERVADRLSRAMRNEPRLVPFWSAALSEAFGPDDDFLLRSTEDQDLIEEMKAGRNAVTRCVLERARHRGEYRRPINLAKLLLACEPDTLDEQAAAEPQYTLAEMLAIPRARLACRVIGRARNALPADQHDRFAFEGLDERLRAGREIADWKPAERYVIAGLLDPEREVRWRGSVIEMLTRAKGLPRDSALRRLLAREVPEFAKVRRRLSPPMKAFVVVLATLVFLIARLGPDPGESEPLTDRVRSELLEQILKSEEAVERANEPPEEETLPLEGENESSEPVREPVALPREMFDEKEKYRRPDGSYDVERWHEDQRRRRHAEPPPR